MTLSQDILKALAVFHLDRPEATWVELKGHLAEVAHNLLIQAYSDQNLSVYDEIYSDLAQSLAEAAATVPLSIDQHNALEISREIVRGARARLKGNPRPLIDTIERLDKPENDVPASISVGAPSSDRNADQAPLTFEELATLFIKERQGNVQGSTLHAIESNCRTLSKLLGDLDIRRHTRSDMVTLKEKIMDGRKPLTVNKLLTQLSTVMDWAVNNGFMERSFDKGLKIERGAESERRPFSREEVGTIMDHTNALPANDWKRWALSLGVLTGARIGELYQLTQADVKQVGDGITVIDINKADEGKTLKTDFSVRMVPLVDGAYGFDLKAFLSWVASEPGKLFKAKYHYFNKPLNDALREPLGLPSGSDQSFHSLRHSLSGLLKAAATPEVIAQSITGHSSGNITYDLYAGSQRVPVETLHNALSNAFKGTRKP
ncbi:tyrosine-type recombinase/integrase [Pseudomonas vanderleydeniana]|uniref:Tyrosine-type recombinase/integrase n=1 Tax=Pseudomonas vanderleydeniana TaxID=2745495 RepID=A0A9E6TQF1_9PSED|nr:tyrosine-type recombinase/integrase [Pseudomonas vanderleydeniana]QXI27448.1 tyrosine-type recombinase/integrase [Pseudomonas vanderleydeniana]